MRFYRWHIIFTILVIIALIFVLNGMRKSNSADLRIAFVADTYVNTQNFKANGTELELLLRDADGNEKKELIFENFYFDNAKERAKKLDQLIEEDEWDLYIADKEAFEGVKNKNGFIEADYLPQSGSEIASLKDEKGRVYAASIKGNTIIKRLGIYEADNLYIAPASGKEKEASQFRKNGRNICYYILENKEKYLK